MNQDLSLQIAFSVAAMGVMVSVAAWARFGRPQSPLDEARARELLTQAFPGRRLDAVWVAVDGRGALAKSGALALVLCPVNESHVGRMLPWAQALAASFKGGRISVDLGDIGQPKSVMFMSHWPPAALDKELRKAKERAA